VVIADVGELDGIAFVVDRLGLPGRGGDGVLLIHAARSALPPRRSPPLRVPFAPGRVALSS